MSRRFLIPLLTAAFLVAPAVLPSSLAPTKLPGLSGSAEARSRTTTRTGTGTRTVAGGITTYRMGGGGGARGGGALMGGGAARMGGGGGASTK
jgi:hypothetical protein